MGGFFSGAHARVPDVNGRRLESTREDLPLVLLPGTLCDARVFGPLLERLAGLTTCIVLTPDAGSLDEAAQAVLRKAPERFALLGFSLGGMIGMELTLRAPARVQGLALISTNPLPVPPERHPFRYAAVNRAQTLPMHKFFHQELWPDYCGTAASSSLLPLLQQMAESLGPAVYARQTRMAVSRGDFRPRLAQVTCPALVLAGSDDRICPPETQQQLAAALPHATQVMLPGVGHFPLLERPDEVAVAVAAWFHNVTQNEATRAGGRSGQTDVQENE